MFPGGYSFNPGGGYSFTPGVVLDPKTMTPMVGASSFTVNPLGVAAKPEQKVWQKMFVKDIPMQCSNECMIKLLSQFGDVKNFKRMNNQRGQLLAFCYFDFQTGQQILRFRRLFKNIRILDKTLQLKISAQTETFIKQWTAIQKDEWRKKLLAPVMNEAKQYKTIEDYHQRDDPKYKQKIQEKLRQINAQVKKCAIEKMREEEKKEHPREKQREKNKKRIQQQLIRNFQQQEDYLLKRQRNKEKQYRKQKQRQRSNEKRKAKRLEKELQMSADEEEKKIAKYLTAERMRAVEKQEMEDIEAILEENPPLPQEQFLAAQQPKKVRATAGQSFQIQQNNNRIQDERNEITLEEANNNMSKKPIKVNTMFKDWDKQQIIHQQVHQYELKLPELQQIEKQKEKENSKRKKIAELQKQIPENRSDLFQYKIDWDRLSKSVVLDRNIRPWLQEQSSIYMGSVQQKFVALVEKRLFSQSKPQKIIKVMSGLIDEDAQQFVIKLWKALILQDLKLKNGLA